MKNVKKKLIVRIAEGLGNQLFMYANAYALSKTYNYELLIDDTSGYFKPKNKIRSYELDSFLIPNHIANNCFKFDTYSKDILRKFKKKIDLFRKFKKFIIETKDSKKNTCFSEINLNYNSEIIFLEGYFECEKYFINYKKDIKKIFQIKDDLIDLNNKFIPALNNSNSVSICIRQNRYSEGKNKNNLKSINFTKDTIDYVYKSINYIKKKVDNPKFFIWSNDFSNLREYFNTNEFVFIENNKNKSLNDFYLFKYCKHFIVGPTSFHWWGAWLNRNPKNICIRPKYINPSNNKNFWPEDWLSI